MKNLSLQLSLQERETLLALLRGYNLGLVRDLRDRLMVKSYMDKFTTKLQKSVDNAAKASNIKMTPAQAAAFDVCYRDVPIHADNIDDVAYIYTNEVLRSLLNEVHRYLANIAIESNAGVYMLR